MSIVVAYEFRCDQTLSEILEALCTGTSWEWHERSSDIWDDYISASVHPEIAAKIYMKVKAFHPPAPEDRGWFVLQMHFRGSKGRVRSVELEREIQECLSSVLEAREFKPTSSYD